MLFQIIYLFIAGFLYSKTIKIDFFWKSPEKAILKIYLFFNFAAKPKVELERHEKTMIELGTILKTWKLGCSCTLENNYFDVSKNFLRQICSPATFAQPAQRFAELLCG